MRHVAPAWYEALNGGKESVACDLKADPELARALVERADIVLEGFRPGVAARLGVGPDDVPESVVYCSITGFGEEGPHAARAGHDLNYLGWAGVLADTAPGLPPLQPADLAAGALGAVVEVLAAVLERERTGRGARLTISMTHGSHRLVSHRLGSDPLPRFLTGGLACYRIYATADGRWLTVGALEPKFFLRLCEVIGRPELADRHLEPHAQEELGAKLAATFASRSLADWLQLFDGEDVCVGPVASLAEGADSFGEGPGPPSAPIGQHTETWRTELGCS
jgi:crotonobetainyl-CoA:carnitine CoA-transferase CaiB-like acyl-CoA transferase